MTLINLKLFCWKFFHSVDRIIAHSAIWIIIQVRPLLAPLGICPFPIGCTQYCIEQLQSRTVPIAAWHTCIRLLCCNPIWLFWRSRR